MLLCGLVLADGQFHYKCCAGTRFAVHGYGPTVGLHRVFDDRQPKTGAACVSRPVLVDAVETLKDMWLVAQRDTNAIVVHADGSRTPVTANLNGNFDARLAAMPEGILHQIVKRLLYSESVGLDPRKMFRHIDCH